MIKEEFVCFRDNLEISGTVIRPAGKSSCPVAVLCHELMGNRQYVAHYAGLLASLGYAAFCFDFCGGCLDGKSAGETTEMSVLSEAEDLKCVIEYALSRDYALPGKTLLFGCSQGGFVAAIAAARAKTVISDLILLYPAFSIPDEMRAGKMIKARFSPDDIPDEFNCGPMKVGKKYVTDIIDADAYELTKGFGGRVLIIHGTADTLVDISYSETACSVYRSCGADVTFRAIDGAGHIFKDPEHISEAMEYIKDFVLSI
ncbi:MAG: alpha/beta hydrolase [Clostridia bacterium]|nr:alpha/beta hydrolase [Clostridia bacterium]